MSWTHYRLVFRLQSPLHVGARTVGNLMQTRPYVPGKVLWAALTARLTRDYHDGRSGSSYEHIGKLLKGYARFGYLWPALPTGDDRSVESADDLQVYVPWAHTADFDSLFLDSYAGTALDYDRNAALDGSLHETEYIASTARDGRPVYLMGDLWLRTPPHEDLAHWKEALGRVQFGGERTYGWGRVHLLPASLLPWTGPALGGITVDYRDDDVLLHLDEGQHTLAHVRATSDGDAVAGLVGPVEPLLGWERNTDVNSDDVWRLPAATITYAPGARLGAAMDFRVEGEEYGVWICDQRHRTKGYGLRTSNSRLPPAIDVEPTRILRAALLAHVRPSGDGIQRARAGRYPAARARPCARHLA